MVPANRVLTFPFGRLNEDLNALTHIKFNEFKCSNLL